MFLTNLFDTLDRINYQPKGGAIISPFNLMYKAVIKKVFL